MKNHNCRLMLLNLGLLVAGSGVPAQAEVAVGAPAGRVEVDMQSAQDNLVGPEGVGAEAELRGLPKGKVLIVRTEEATPPPTEEEMTQRIRKAIEETQQAVEQSARQVAQAEAGKAVKTARKVAETEAGKVVEAAQRLAQAEAGKAVEIAQRLAQVEAGKAVETAQRAAQQVARAEAGKAVEEARQVAQTEAGKAVETADKTAREVARTTVGKAEEKAQVAQQVAQAAVVKAVEEAFQTRQEVRSVADKAVQTAQTEVEKARVQIDTRVADLAGNLETLKSQQQEAPKAEQVKAIAAQTVAQYAPEFKALALASVKDSQDYIRTVARSAVKDEDPDMKEALISAAQQAIVSDDRVVFTIRKVISDQLASRGDMPSGPENLGTEDDVNVDASRLGVAELVGAMDAAKLGRLEPASGESLGSFSATSPRADWIDIRKYRVVLHADAKTLPEMMSQVIAKASKFAGPWRIKWKISDENRDLLDQRFSIDVESSFEDFVSYLAQYLMNDRGMKITFSLFDSERVVVVSD